MRHRTFHRPIRIQTGRIDRDRIVTNTRDAAAILLRDWPLADCEKRRWAMEICLEVIKGNNPPNAARQAFVRAARKARILLDDETSQTE